MAKVIYMIVLKDHTKVDENLAGFETLDEAVDFMERYTIDNYGTSFDMRAAGAELALESVILQTSKSLAK